MEFKTIIKSKFNNQKNGCSSIRVILKFGKKYLKYLGEALKIFKAKGGLQAKNLNFDNRIYLILKYDSLL
jgi:hypothetical protein